MDEVQKPKTVGELVNCLDVNLEAAVAELEEGEGVLVKELAVKVDGSHGAGG